MGNPRMNCVADDLHRRPLADRGSPGRTHGNAVTNPRIRVCSTVVLTVPSPALRNSFIPPRPDFCDGTAHARPTSLTTNIRVHATELAVEPHLQILRRYRRPLLLCLEYPHRSALENHVHRTPRLGRRRSVNLRIGIRGPSSPFCSTIQVRAIAIQVRAIAIGLGKGIRRCRQTAFSKNRANKILTVRLFSYVTDASVCSRNL